MPALAPPVADERAGLAAYLHQQQDAFRAVTHGLTDEQARLTPTPSALSLGALVKHVTGAQRSWLQKALAAPDVPDELGSEQDRAAAYQDEFTFHAHDRLSDVLADFDTVSAHVQDAVRQLDLDTPVPVPSAPWFPKDVNAWSVRWVWFHLIEELARHAGHADIIREAVDGATMYALIAAREGWPETPWLTPWRPPASAPGGQRVV
jgi:uncharacterized damage-inducible protein DinB